MRCQQETEKGRQVEKQAVAENARKHNSINAIQRASWTVWGEEQERKCFHKGPHTAHSTVRDLSCGLDPLFWGNFCLLSHSRHERHLPFLLLQHHDPLCSSRESKGFPTYYSSSPSFLTWERQEGFQLWVCLDFFESKGKLNSIQIPGTSDSR